MKCLRRSGCVATLIVLSVGLLHTSAHAQVVAEAIGPADSIWVGGEYSNFHASFPYQSNQRLAGVGVFADVNLNSRFGLEGDARFLEFGGFADSTESSYLAGPKVYVFPKGRFQPYGKFLVGAGKIHYPFDIGDATYFAMAPGAGASYRLSHRWMVRAEYEYQIWTGSPGYPSEPNHPLTPNGIHVGVAFKVFR